MRLVTLALTLAVLLATPAAAAVRFAAPGASGGEPCNPTPCPITTAISSATPAGSEVIVAPGTYDDGGTTLSATVGGLNIHGQDGAPRPVITIESTNYAMFLPGSDVVRHLDLRLNSLGTPGSVVLQAGPDATIDDVAVTDLAMSNATGIDVSGDDTVRNTTVLVTGLGSTGVAGTLRALNAPPVTFVHDTIWAPGSGSVGIQATASCFNFMQPGCGLNDASYSFVLRDVLVRGGTNGAGIADLEAQVAQTSDSTRTSSIDVQYSDYVTTKGAGPITAAHDIAGAPMLADPAHGDFHERPGSPTIDAGAAQPGDDPTDPDGRPRALGVATDIGAYEAPAPVIAGAAAQATGPGSALVTATVDPEGDPATVVLGYGPDTSYATTTPAVSVTGFGPQPVSFAVTGLDPATTYHLRLSATDSFAAVSGDDLVLAPTQTPAGGGPSGPGPGGPGSGSASVTAPVITAFQVVPRRFRAKRSPATISKAGPKRKPSPVGGGFAIALSTAARVKITITRTGTGVRSGRSCVAPPRRHRHAKRCTRTITVGSVTTARPAGTSTLAFAGDVGGRPLAARAYRATAVATGPTGLRSKPRSASFTIVNR